MLPLLLLLCCCASLSVAYVPPGDGDCPSGWVPVPNPDPSDPRPPRSCARVHPERASWFRAKALCVEEGGARLAEVNSFAEAEFVRKMGKGWVAAEEKGEQEGW